MDADYDVIIVGAGGAGLSAAVVAHDAGARVLVVEAGETVGGSTALSGGVYYAAGTSVQRARGITDTADAMFEYYMTLNQWRVEPALARHLADHAAEGLEWLITLGVEFPAETLYASGVESVPRGHSAKGNGASIAAALDQARKARSIDVALKTKVDGLIVEGGRVTGIRSQGQEARARCVVVTTGGFGQSPSMIAELYPEAAAAGSWVWSISAPNCTGDGLRLGRQAGAAITGHNRGLLLTTPGFSKHLEVYVPGWLVYVNRHGRRFIDEMAAYAVMSGVIKEQGGVAWAIFDEASRAQAEPAAAYADAFAAGALPLNWVNTVLKEMADKGRIYKANTLGELAAQAGINGAALESTVGRYNHDAANGKDTQFFKDGSLMRPIGTPPFYAVEVRPAIVALTSTGLRIDDQCHVLDEGERVVPGLFAAGETTGGVLGDRYVGGGNSIANAIVFGRLAGRTAAQEALAR